MKKLISITILVAGLLLLVVPRYILPACEYEGFSRMHCSDTAAAEFIIGALMLVTGGIAFAVRKPWLVVIAGAVACALLALAFFMPEVYGYCANRKMPCHYGMVPGIRFIAVLLSLILMIGTALLARDILRRKAP
ncbi:MAG TPA: DUF4418 family protein [Nitrospirota bacterium]|nr:DUF4418 family protein [Nitrospirota bacterium]